MRGKQKRYLRSQAHNMRPVFQIGKDGLSTEWLKQVEEAVEKAVDEVNVQISANTAAIDQIRTSTGAIPVVTPKTQEKPWDK